VRSPYRRSAAAAGQVYLSANYIIYDTDDGGIFFTQYNIRYGRVRVFPRLFHPKSYFPLWFYGNVSKTLLNAGSERRRALSAAAVIRRCRFSWDLSSRFIIIYSVLLLLYYTIRLRRIHVIYSPTADMIQENRFELCGFPTTYIKNMKVIFFELFPLFCMRHLLSASEDIISRY